MALHPLPTQSPDVPWPTEKWPETPPDADVDLARIQAVSGQAFVEPVPESHGETLALLAVHRGRLVFERYAPGKTDQDTFVSWSMAKSILHAGVGILCGRGLLDPQQPAPVPGWKSDARGRIRLEDLLRMVDGLDFAEVYEDGSGSDVIEMLFKSGKDDVAAFAEARPSAHPPGSYWNYSSGTSNVVSAIVRRRLAAQGDDTLSFLQRDLFDILGMKSAKPRCDPAGTFIGSSYVFATARDFARFGLLYLRNGIWEGRRLLPEGWVDHARTPTPASFGQYGAHWWLALDGTGIFTANGFNGQYIVVDPSRDLVLVRLGISNPNQRPRVVHGLREIVEAFPRLESP